jgi:hypothetical protein
VAELGLNGAQQVKTSGENNGIVLCGAAIERDSHSHYKRFVVEVCGGVSDILSGS